MGPRDEHRVQGDVDVVADGEPAPTIEVAVLVDGRVLPDSYLPRVRHDYPHHDPRVPAYLHSAAHIQELAQMPTGDVRDDVVAQHVETACEDALDI